MNAWYQMTVADVVARLGSDRDRGLDPAEARRRLEVYGPNELTEKGGRTRLDILREQLTGILTLLLVAAAILSMALGDWLEAVVILIIVVLNAILGYIQEYRAEQALAALKRMAVPRVRVRRAGQIQEISAREVVPGDIVLLETGNIIPADGRVVRAFSLRVEEAALTGESEPVDKEADRVYATERALGDRHNVVYSGTIVSYGHGEFIVTETGMRTELGRIATMLQEMEPEQTPLQQRLNRAGRVLAYAAGVLVGVVIVLGLLRGTPLRELVLTAISLAVAAVPEALTAVVTIALSLGAQRMLRRQALIRKLPAVETLGSVSVICSDKTGTLTLNRMTVTAVDIADHTFGIHQTPTGQGWEMVPVNGIHTPGTRPTLDLVLIASALCNDATLVIDETRPGGFYALGDPTEAALVMAAAYTGIRKDELERALPRVAEVPFDAVRKRMTTVHKVPCTVAEVPDGLRDVWERRAVSALPPYVAFTKGAVESLLSIADRVWVEGRIHPLDSTWRERIMAANDRMAARGMRVIGIALRGWQQPPAQATPETVEQHLILVGMFGMIDPPRPEVRQAVAACRSAGILPVMITGDHPLTALSIAQQVGIATDDRFLTGSDLDRLSLDELIQATQTTTVFARVSPEHKLKLIDAFQRQGHIVAMTGDGVNDAPALKKADIGVAMGITGTDVAKGAADMVLLDDNFATIVAAVEEGRVIYDNIRRFIKYLLTCNTSEVAVMILGPLLGMPLPLLPLQILWMNLITDGLPALALSVEPAEVDVMKRPPFSAHESVFGRGMVRFILGVGGVMSLIAVAVGWWLWRRGEAAWQTVLFTSLVFNQLAVALEARSETQPLWRLGLFSNRFMIGAFLSTLLLQLAVVYLAPARSIFTTTPLTPAQLALTLALALSVLVIIEWWKWHARRSRSG
jgi:Ca2+-transporting ATPase